MHRTGLGSGFDTVTAIRGISKTVLGRDYLLADGLVGSQCKQKLNANVLPPLVDIL